MNSSIYPASSVNLFFLKPLHYGRKRTVSATRKKLDHLNAVPVQSFLAKIHPHMLCFCIHIHRLNTEFAAKSALLRAAKRRRAVEHAECVHIYSSGLEPAGHSVRPLQIIRPNSGCQSVKSVIGFFKASSSSLKRMTETTGPKISS